MVPPRGDMGRLMYGARSRTEGRQAPQVGERKSAACVPRVHVARVRTEWGHCGYTLCTGVTITPAPAVGHDTLCLNLIHRHARRGVANHNAMTCLGARALGGRRYVNYKFSVALGTDDLRKQVTKMVPMSTIKE